MRHLKKKTFNKTLKWDNKKEYTRRRHEQDTIKGDIKHDTLKGVTKKGHSKEAINIDIKSRHEHETLKGGP